MVFIALLIWPTSRLYRLFLSAIEEDGPESSLFLERLTMWIFAAMIAAMGVGLVLAVFMFVAVYLGL